MQASDLAYRGGLPKIKGWNMFTASLILLASPDPLMVFDSYIFNTPSLLSGAARALDLGATFDRGSYLLSDTPTEADVRAAVSDWQAVGRDLQLALEQYESAAEEETEQAA